MSISTAERSRSIKSEEPPSPAHRTELSGDSISWYRAVQGKFDSLREIVQGYNKQPTNPTEQPPTDLVPLALALSKVYMYKRSPTEYGDWHILKCAADIIKSHNYLKEAERIMDNIGAGPNVQFSAPDIDPDFPLDPDNRISLLGPNDATSIGTLAINTEWILPNRH